MESYTENARFDASLWEAFLDELFSLHYSAESSITDVEQRIYTALQQDPDRIQGLIVLMFEQLMQGNRTRAKALAYKIWEIGGSLQPFFEMIYINNLLNLGLLDMASILIKPRFEQIKDSLEDFYPVMVKFAVMTGSIPLLNRLSAYPEASDDVDLYNFAAFYAHSGRSEQFKNIQKLILENSAEYLCTYEYDLDTVDGKPFLEIILYTTLDKFATPRLEQNLHTKIIAYCRSQGLEPLNSVQVTVRNIKSHEAWDGGDLDDDEIFSPADAD